jgi:hypothetical protein
VGTSKSFGQLQRKFQQAEDRTRKQFPKTLRASVKIMHAELAQEIEADAPRGMHRVKKGRKPRQVGVRPARFKLAEDRGTGTGYIRARGPVIWLEKGTQPHLIGAGRTGGTVSTARRVRKVKYLKGANFGHPVRAPLAHPGAKPKKTWTKGSRRGLVKTTQHFRATALGETLKAFV